MSKDLNPLLARWAFDPEEFQVRIVAGLDGREKIQRRIDLGLLQLEIDGRPDGATPEGAESYLDHLEVRAAADADFALEPSDCAELLREGLQYYHRYLALFHLQRYDLVARDTGRNLRLFAFVVKHASREVDKLQFDQYRPYVTMMHARARGLAALERGDHAGALAHIDAGILGIRAFLAEYDHDESQIVCHDLDVLRRWRKEVERAQPVGPVERLAQQLDLAVNLEQYEEAARLRDQLRRLRAAGLGVAVVDSAGDALELGGDAS